MDGGIDGWMMNEWMEGWMDDEWMDGGREPALSGPTRRGGIPRTSRKNGAAFPNEAGGEVLTETPRTLFFISSNSPLFSTLPHGYYCSISISSPSPLLSPLHHPVSPLSS